MEQVQSNTKVAGVDVGKQWLDVAVHGLEDLTQVDNGPAGLAELIVWLKARDRTLAVNFARRIYARLWAHQSGRVLGDDVDASHPPPAASAPHAALTR